MLDEGLDVAQTRGGEEKRLPVCGQLASMNLMSLMNPMSSMRSASSRTTV